MTTFHVRLRCPRCHAEKTVVITWRTRLLETIGRLPPDTRCSRCWGNGYTLTTMSIVAVKMYPRSGRVASEQPLSAVIQLPASTPTPGEAA